MTSSYKFSKKQPMTIKLVEKNIPLESEKSPENQTTDDFFDFGSSSLTLTVIPKSELEV